MNKRTLVFAAVWAGILAAPARSAEYLTAVTSDVYEAQGTPREIATRANTCIAQNLKPGLVNAPLIVTSDLDNGVIVARSAVEYADGWLTWQIRSTFTFEARDGRFRIEQTSLERFHDGPGAYNVGWNPIGKWTGSGWKKAQGAFELAADVVARCVVAGPAARSDW